MMDAHPLVARVVGQASRRGLIPRVPTGDRLLVDVEAWLIAEYPDFVRTTRRSTREVGEAQPEVGGARLDISLHPAAPELIVTATDTGRVSVEAETVVVGPGYHRFVGRVIERMGLELAITWGRVDADPGDEAADSTIPESVDRATAEHAYLVWLGRKLVAARSASASGGSGIHLGTPAGTRFTFDGAIATVLGPRDDAWLDAAVGDTRIATDITPWWADATDGQCLINRALCLMWLDVRWRQPAFKAEGLLLDEVHRLLSKAFPVDPTLAYPWRAWAEIVGLRGIDDPMARQVVARAAHAPDDSREIGYRRAPVAITHEGWALEIPGSFAERRTPDEWWGGGAGRGITLAAVPTGSAAGAMGAAAFIQQFGGDLGPDAIDHRAGGVMGRATLTTDTSSGVEVGVLEGYSAVVGSGAAIRIVFDDPADWQWAIDMWRSLAPG